MKRIAVLCVSLLISMGVLAQTPPPPITVIANIPFTATSQTSSAYPLGASYSVCTITLTGVSLTTATFGMTASYDLGVTYVPILIWAVATPGTTATTATATAATVYQANCGGAQFLKAVTSSTFTATSVNLLVTASPNAQLSKNSSGGGPPTGAAGGDLSGTYPNPGVAKVNGASVPTSAGVVGTNSGGQLIAAHGALINIQYITATGSGTYTPTAGTNSVIVEIQAAGGGGGGAGAGGGGVSLPSTGSGGAWGRFHLSANFSGATYSVGAAGTGGATGNNNGTNGGDTTFTSTTPTTWTAGGGPLGAGNGSQGGPSFSFGGGGGVVSGGTFDVNRAGGSSPPSVALNAGGRGWAGPGGDSMYSSGGAIVNVFNTGVINGNAAPGYGGGGSAGLSLGSASTAAGGNGSNGIIIIYEYN